MNELSERSADLKPRSPWAKRILIALIILLPFGLALQFFINYTVMDAIKLRRAFDQADRLDPGWRYLELEAKRPKIPDAENSALEIRALAASMPANWPTGEIHQLWRFEPMQQLTYAQRHLLRIELERAGSVVTAARRLANMPRGRHPIRYGPTVMGTPMPHIEPVRTIGNVLLDDALQRLEEGNADGALESARGALNVSRSFGEEGFGLSVHMRCTFRSFVLRFIERVLANGRPSPAALETTQKLLEMDAAEPMLLHNLRIERAWTDRTVEEMQETGVGITAYAEWGGKRLTDNDYIDGIINLFRYGSVTANRAALLEANNQVVEIAKLPIQEQRDALKHFRTTLPNSPLFVTSMAGAGADATMARCHMSVAEMHAMITALSAERFRMANDRWPKNLEELTPKFLEKVPIDPFSKGLIQLRVVPDGLVIYSFGRDETDNGGTFDRQKYPSTGYDLGYQLWKPAKRRLPPRPPPGKT